VLHHALETGQDIAFETSQRGKADFGQFHLQVLQIVIAQGEVGEQVVSAVYRVGIVQGKFLNGITGPPDDVCGQGAQPFSER
jgi:hypothetical protein